jgi:hypothetical protein
VALNERAWQIVVREFAPVPLASRIPYTTLPRDATEVLAEVAAEPLGVEEAQRRIAG